jgi:hypothetical protein
MARRRPCRLNAATAVGSSGDYPRSGGRDGEVLAHCKMWPITRPKAHTPNDVPKAMINTTAIPLAPLIWPGLLQQSLYPSNWAAAQPTVNRLVAGSNPARGAITEFARCFLMIFSAFCQTFRQV